MTERSELPQVLSRLRLFKYCTSLTREMVANHLQLQTFAAGETLLAAGDQGDTMLIILGGTVEVSQSGEHLREMTTGDTVGELAVFSPAPRSADVVAVTDVEVAELSAGGLRIVLSNSVAVAEELLAALAERVRELSPGS
jgi:CRP-like cAMP-binding protein